MRAWSDEYTKFKWSGKCPGCGNRHVINVVKAFSSWKCFDGKGQPFSALTPIWSMPEGAYMVCQKCGYKLTVFEGEKAVSIKVELLDLQETHRSEERIGRDERLIDNASGLAELSRKLLITREWSRECKLELENAHRSSEGFTVGEANTARLSVETETLLKRRYSINESTRETYTEEVSIAVPPGFRIRILIDWKKLWQHGVIKVRGFSGEIGLYHFRVASGVTFDLTQSPVEA